MSKYDINTDIISTTGLVIDNRNISISTGKVIINDVEITDIDSWNKAIATFNDLNYQIKEKDKEITRLNNIINEAIDKAKTMKASMLLDAVDGIDIDSQFVNALFELIDFLEKRIERR